MSLVTKSALRRLNDTTWAYQHPEIEKNEIQEIHINIEEAPLLHTYSLVDCISKVFDQHIQHISQQSLEKGIDIRITKSNIQHPLHGKWHIFAKKRKVSWLSYISSCVPFLQSIEPKNILEVSVTKPHVSIISKIQDFFRLTIACPEIERRNSLFKASLESISSQSIYERITRESFQDPFTTLSSQCLNSLERYFVMEQEHRGTWRFVIDQTTKELLLQQIPTTPSVDDSNLVKEQEENREVVNFYKNFLKEEFGASYLEFLKANYNIDFDIMAEKGEPLYPDHICKCNIGVQNIEITHVNQLYKTIHALKNLLESQANPLPNSIELLLQEISKHKETPLSHRELRGLLRNTARYAQKTSSSDVTREDLERYLASITDPNKTKLSLTPNSTIHEYVSMMVATENERNLSFTGRKISHLAIMGFHTMGNRQIACPARDMFELLHIFSDLEREQDWSNYYELLSHVVVKKSLFRKNDVGSENKDEQQWHVGLIIPAPKTKGGAHTWYYNNECVDDGNGNVNYTLIPISEQTDKKYHTDPMIKVYRSTASDKNAMNWQDSVQADLNPHGSPGSLNPDISYKYEKNVFHKRTIPLWVGYTLAAYTLIGELKQLNPNSLTYSSTQETINEFLYQMTESLKKYIETFFPEDLDIIDRIQELKKEEKYTELKQALATLAEKYDELPQKKIPQNISFVGHSLGGSLAQFGTYYFGTRVDRIPLPNCFVSCYASDSPKIDTDKDIAFMQFGRKHKKLLALLGKKWKIYHQLEYGDFVPQAGGSHLGTNGYNDIEDSPWLDFKARVFRPLPSATAQSITTAPTHGRRIGTAAPGIDHVTTNLTPRELYTFDHALLLTGNLANVFGYAIFKSPIITEKARKIIARALYPVNRIVDSIVGNKIGSRDKNGVFYASVENL